jgi:hypothetical protein
MTRAEQAAKALRIVNQDLEAAGIPAPTIAWVQNGVELSFRDGAGHWTNVDLVQSDAEVLERVADMVHDYLVEDMWSLGRPSNWPPCPDHPRSHPLRVLRDGDDVSWACPAGGRSRIPVGELGANAS